MAPGQRPREAVPLALPTVRILRPLLTAATRWAALAGRSLPQPCAATTFQGLCSARHKSGPARRPVERGDRPTPGLLVTRYPCSSGHGSAARSRETQRLSRGTPDCCRRTSVGCTRLGHATDGRLRLVLQTRLGLTSPDPPAAEYSHPATYLFVTPRLRLRLPSGIHYWATLAFSYPSPPSGWDWTLPGARVSVPRTAPASSRARPAHIGIGTPLAGRPSHTTTRTGP